MHWADVAAKSLSHRGNTHVISTGITPSGEFHIGHLREILTGDMLARAARDAGLDVDFIFIVDSADPLRKVYSFLGPEFEQFIGHQIGAIPAPKEDDNNPDWQRFNDEGWTYADHFLTPFMEALAEIGVRPRIVDNLSSYRDGKFAEMTKIACDSAEQIREIIERVSSRELATDWFPWSPLDSKQSLDDVKVTGYEYPLVHWIDSHGVEGSSDITKGEGKLPWRIDWPAKWSWIGVTCEAFGKDHGAAGGSYATGREISTLLGHQPPQPLTYEWISLRGKGAMSSSAGNTIGPIEALRLVPPQILRLLIANSKPNKAIEFDTGMGLVTLADEFERLCTRDFDNEINDENISRRQLVQVEDAKAALRLSMVEPGTIAKATSVSFRHLALLAQTKSSDDAIWQSLISSAVITEPTKQLEDRLARMRYWIESEHFPEEMRINILTKPNLEVIEKFSKDEAAILRALFKELSNCQWNQKEITAAIPRCVESLVVPHKWLAYKVAYLCLMGIEKGPRLAPILVEIDKTEILQLLDASVQVIRN